MMNQKLYPSKLLNKITLILSRHNVLLLQTRVLPPDTTLVL